MSPYFPHIQSQEYTCQGCGRRFRKTGLSCCVLHPPGTCCHYGEISLPSGQRIGPSGQAFTEYEPPPWRAEVVK